MNLKAIPGITQEQLLAIEAEMKAANQRRKLSAVFIAAAGKVRADMGGDPHSIERATALCKSFNTYAESEDSTVRLCVEGTLPATVTVKPPTPGKVK